MRVRICQPGPGVSEDALAGVDMEQGKSVRLDSPILASRHVRVFVLSSLAAGREPGPPDRAVGSSTMPASGHAIPFIALQDGKFNVTDEAAEFLKSVRLLVGIAQAPVVHEYRAHAKSEFSPALPWISRRCGD